MEATDFIKSYEERLFLTTDDAQDAINRKMQRANELGVIKAFYSNIKFTIIIR